MTIERVGNKVTSFPWAIVEKGIPSQARFLTEEAAEIAYRNYSRGIN